MYEDILITFVDRVEDGQTWELVKEGGKGMTVKYGYRRLTLSFKIVQTLSLNIKITLSPRTITIVPYQSPQNKYKLRYFSPFVFVFSCVPSIRLMMI